jgi:hypothetical protein
VRATEKEKEERKKRKEEKKEEADVFAACLAPRSMAPSTATSIATVATSTTSWRQERWRHAVIFWRHRQWRQAEGPFFEIFPPRAYLRESFEKGPKNKKDGWGRAGKDGNQSGAI